MAALFARHRIDPARTFKAVQQRMLDQGRCAVGKGRARIEILRAARLVQRDAVGVQPAGHIGAQHRQRPVDFLRVGGPGGEVRLDGIDLPGRRRADQVAAAA